MPNSMAQVGWLKQDWSPQAMFTAFQACRRRLFVLFRNVFFVRCLFVRDRQDLSRFVNIDQYTVLRTVKYRLYFQYGHVLSVLTQTAYALPIVYRFVCCTSFFSLSSARTNLAFASAASCRILINIDNILTNIGHRFVHQSGLDQSSGRNSTFFRHRIAFRAYY